MAKQIRGLGKGLDALFLDNETSDVSVNNLPINEIEPDSSQPRQFFDQDALAELADSIKEHGIINPIIVRPLPNGRYQIIAGERRWRAAKIAGINTVPVSVKDVSNTEADIIALTDNLVRTDLNPIEEALGYKKLAETYKFTQEEIAQKVGRSRPVVANALRLLILPNEVIELLKNGKLSSGHARALLSITSRERIIELANEIVRNDLSVRETEHKAKMLLKAQKEPPSKKEILKVPAFYKEAEISLGEYLSTKVTISPVKNKKGSINIEFYSENELKDICKKISK